MAANPNSKGSYGLSSAGDENTEYGVALGYSDDHLHGQVGYMSRPIGRADNQSMGNRSLFDVGLGANLGPFAVDIEYSVIDSVAKNSLSPNDTTDHEKPGTARLFLASYKINDKWLVGARYEHLENDPAEASIDAAESMGGAVHYRLREDLDLRAEFVSYHYKNVSEVQWDESRSNLALVFMF